MSTPRAEESRDGEGSVGAEEVVAYLAAHPELFEQRPELLAKLRIPHRPGAAVSLIERQVEVLRAQLETERRRLAHLIARAREYETLANRLHGLVVQIIAAPTLERLGAVLAEALRREFSADAVILKLFRMDADAEAAPDLVVGAFLEFVDREHALCGPLDAERNGALFGEQHESIRSAALIPIRADERCGVLAIGSGDPQRFTCDMGTELLDRLGEVVSQKVRAWPEGGV